MKDSKETVPSRHNRADIHMNSEIVAAGTEPVLIQAREDLSIKRGK